MVLELSKDHAYVLLGGIGSWTTVMWMAMNVSRARKKYGIKYPQMYADSNDSDGNTFNCIQRAHQNTLEGLSNYYFFLALSGIKYPKFAAGCSAVWILGRILYARGYYTGDPKKRSQGSVGMIGLLALIGCTGHTALKLLGAY